MTTRTMIYRGVEGQRHTILSPRFRPEGLRRPLVEEYLRLRRGQAALFGVHHQHEDPRGDGLSIQGATMSDVILPVLKDIVEA